MKKVKAKIERTDIPIDIEAELTAMLSEQLAKEIDKEILKTILGEDYYRNKRRSKSIGKIFDIKE
jgi:hypothetical protein